MHRILTWKPVEFRDSVTIDGFEVGVDVEADYCVETGTATLRTVVTFGEIYLFDFTRSSMSRLTSGTIERLEDIAWQEAEKVD